MCPPDIQKCWKLLYNNTVTVENMEGYGMKREKVKNKSSFMLFGIRNKVVLCFLVPIIFMIIVGVSAYQKAATGMREKFQESTIQTISMARDYVEMSCMFIESEGTRYAFATNVSN